MQVQSDSLSATVVFSKVLMNSPSHLSLTS
uniref:Uncharacterized protein n=1 Tax=Anguilla anguilla TaxID=7936 RepID=A0A0E9VW91_ANGAN